MTLGDVDYGFFRYFCTQDTFLPHVYDISLSSDQHLVLKFPSIYFHYPQDAFFKKKKNPSHYFIFIRREACSYVVSNPEPFTVSSIEHISPRKPLAMAALTKVMTCNTATWVLCVYHYRDTVRFLSLRNLSLSCRVPLERTSFPLWPLSFYFRGIVYFKDLSDSVSYPPKREAE